MSYRRTTPVPGGRRDQRQRAVARTRTTRSLAGGVALAAFAAGSFASVGVNAWATSSQGLEQAQAGTELVEPVAAAAADIEVVTRTEEVGIDHDSVEEQDYGSLKGTSTVLTEGQDGTALVSYTVTLKDGVEVDRDEGIRVVVEEPVDEVVAVGALSIPATSNSGANRALGKSMAASLYGWSGAEWECLNVLWTKESNWRHNAHNSSSGAHGIPQALPGNKMAKYGSDWATNPATQIEWGLAYVKGRYGTPCGAWGHFLDRNWY